MKPISNRRFWFYDDWTPADLSEYKTLSEWFKVNFKASDEYGHHTVVIPLGKRRAMIVAYRAGYKRFKHCEFCLLARTETLEMEQDFCYVQTYFNLEDYDDVYDLDVDDWNEALGIS